MKTAVSVPYWPPQFHTIHAAEKAFSNNVAPHAHIGRAYNQARSFRPLRVPIFFLISVVRALMLITMAMIKVMSAIFFALEVLFRSAMSGTNY